MNKTRKAFICAGSIIAIVFSVLMLLSAGVLLIAKSYVTEETFAESYLVMDGSKHTEADGSYIIEYFDPEDSLVKEISEGEIKMMVKITQTVIVVVAAVFFVTGVIQLILGILLLVNSSKGKKCKGLIVTLLVFSILGGSILTTAFMIVALCLKHKPQQELEQQPQPEQVQ